MENIVRLRPHETEDAPSARPAGLACCVDLPEAGDGRRGAALFARERALRDRLTGRTPRSERGDRGSTPCPGVTGRIAESSAKQPRRGGSCGKTEAVVRGFDSLPVHSRASSSSGRALSHKEEA